MSVTPVTSMSASQNNANVITNSNMFTLAAELRREMLDRVDAEPGSPVERDFYIIGDTPTGSSASWTDNAKDLALFLGGDWFTWVPARGQIYTKPDGTAVEWDGTDWVTPSGGSSTIDYILIRDEKAATVGGSAAGAAWTQRELNTEVRDTGGNATLTSNRFTLVEGTYMISVSAPFWQVNTCTLRLLQDPVSTQVEVIQGIHGYAPAGDRTMAIPTLKDIITVTGTAALRTYEIQYFVETAKTTDGLGVAMATETSVFCEVQLWKLS